LEEAQEVALEKATADSELGTRQIEDPEEEEEEEGEGGAAGRM
jgi:hypothetical protein